MAFTGADRIPSRTALPTGNAETKAARLSGRDLVKDFVERYGDRGAAVLAAAVEAMLELNERGIGALGDFDYRTLKEKLRERGESLNPARILDALEKEYGLVTLTYKSSKQRWWSFADRELVLGWYEGEAGRIPQDLASKVLLAKYKVLRPEDRLRRLEELRRRPALSLLEEQEVKSFVLGELGVFLELYEELRKHGDRFAKETGILARVIELAYVLASRARGR